MFTAIAPRYDLLNHLLSLNIDKRWRRAAVACLGWERKPAGSYLDLCAGTLDLGAALGGQAGFQGRVVGADFVLPMLLLGRSKSERVRPVNADALELPFPTGTFDGAMVGFGVRNLADLDAGLAEAFRVLAAGSRLVILELSTPNHQPLRGLYGFYFTKVLPTIGRLVSRHRDAYDYLPDSVLAFPEPEALAARMRNAGFGEVAFQRLLGGIAAIHVGSKL
jgi:demethylmenaquinone methyltransferase/2-methoxy-6-polyprenyl-1,4-benzoquinol methylase